MKFEKVAITPKLAKELLERNSNNRRLDTKLVSRYVEEMKEGKWRENTAEMIKISKNDIVLDGQHRLHAVAESGMTIYFHVATGLDEEVFEVLDTGKKRTSQDVLHINGAKNSSSLSGAINRYLSLRTGSKGRKLSGSTNQLVLEEYRTRPVLWDNMIENCVRWYKQFNCIIPVSLIGGWYAFLHHINSDDAFSFFEQLCTGDEVKNSTINVLRNAFIKDKLSTNKMTEEKRSALILKTWNCYRKATTLQVLSYNAANDDKLKAE